MPENKPDQLEILCEIPLVLKIGECECTVRPLTFGKLIRSKSSIIGILNGISSIEQLAMSVLKSAVGLMPGQPDGKLETEKLPQMEDFLGQLFDKLESVMGDVCALMRVLLVTPNDFELTDEFLKEHLDTVTLGTILGFLVKTANIGETVKNVSVLRGMAKS